MAVGKKPARATSRATANSAGKPPPPADAVSEERALRYLVAGEEPASARGSFSDAADFGDAESRPKSRESSSGALPAGQRREAAAAAAKEAEAAAAAPGPDPALLAEWNYFAKPPPQPAGALLHFSRGGARAGMSHPPQNPAVQLELLQHIEKIQLPARAERRPIRQRPSQAPEEEGSPKSLTASLQSRLSTRGHEAQGLGSPTSSSGSPPGTRGCLGWTLPWAPEMPLPRGDSPPAARRPQRKTAASKSPSAAELWAQVREMQNKDGSTPPPVTFEDMRRWGRDLVAKSRDHGIDLSQRTVDDVSDLAMYHNGPSRSSSSFAPRASREASAAMSLRELTTSVSTWNDTVDSPTAALPWRSASATHLVGRRHGFVLAPSLAESMQAVRGNSAKKLRDAAEAVMVGSPSRLQFFADIAGVSMATGSAAHRDREEWLMRAARAH